MYTYNMNYSFGDVNNIPKKKHFMDYLYSPFITCTSELIQGSESIMTHYDYIYDLL